MYEFNVVLEYDSNYFERDSTAKDALTVAGRNGWQLVAVVPLAENRGYAIIYQREV